MSANPGDPEAGHIRQLWASVKSLEDMSEPEDVHLRELGIRVQPFKPAEHSPGLSTYPKDVVKSYFEIEPFDPKYLEEYYGRVEVDFLPWRPMHSARRIEQCLDISTFTAPHDLVNSEEGLSSRERECGFILEYPKRPHIIATVTHNILGSNKPSYREIVNMVKLMESRVKQKEYVNAPDIPVLLLSFMGPQHGGILNAVNTFHGELSFQISKLYSFQTIEEAPFDLFLRWLMARPGMASSEIPSCTQTIPVRSLV
ncbi:hypothetical protein VTN00DRAFT_3412 [Thermoascus crustaceus]|uniref:uncharacterized protein n=1 Tax=Thermoascus crustaceus TaxID=5088 RepID=UPI003744741A